MTRCAGACWTRPSLWCGGWSEGGAGSGAGLFGHRYGCAGELDSSAALRPSSRMPLTGTFSSGRARPGKRPNDWRDWRMRCDSVQAVSRLEPGRALDFVPHDGGLTIQPNPAISSSPMVHVFFPLRVARILGLLAALLTAGLGQHVHAAKMDLAQTITAECLAPSEAPADHDAPGTLHCGFCHAARATLPAAHSLRAPVMLATRPIPVESARWLDPLFSGVPSPPPRRRAAA